MKQAILFGSIGVIAETSDIQRRAYNAALKEAGLDWIWERETYAELLEQAGGKERLTTLARATGNHLTDAQIDTIHTRKTEIACAEIVRDGFAPRRGVVALIKMARDHGIKIGFVTTTYQPNIDAIFAGSRGALQVKDFDYIVDRAAVKTGKPAPDAYQVALKALGVDAGDALAIEDTAVSVMSAKRAGVLVVATPGAITAGQDFWQADLVLDGLAGTDGEIDPQLAAMVGCL